MTTDLTTMQRCSRCGRELAEEEPVTGVIAMSGDFQELLCKVCVHMDTDVDRIVALIRERDGYEREMATILAAFSPLEYEQNLPRIVSETGRNSTATHSSPDDRPAAREDRPPLAVHHPSGRAVCQLRSTRGRSSLYF